MVWSTRRKREGLSKKAVHRQTRPEIMNKPVLDLNSMPTKMILVTRRFGGASSPCLGFKPLTVFINLKNWDKGKICTPNISHWPIRVTRFKSLFM